MIRTIKLAFSYLRYYKKQTLSLFLGVVMSAALMTGVGSLIYSGRMADIERIRELYGDAHYYFHMNDGDFDNLEEHLQEHDFTVDHYGILTVKKSLKKPYALTFVSADSEYMEMFHRTLLEGTYPDKPGEIALARRTIRNLEVSDTLGSTVIIDGDSYILSGILSDQWDENVRDMKAFVSKDSKHEDNSPLLYVKFKENGDVLSQASAFAQYFHYDIRKIERVSTLTTYVGGNLPQSVFFIIQTGLTLPEGRLAYIWGTLNETCSITEKLVLAILGLFSSFVVFSLFQVSVRKRAAQYSAMQVLGMTEKRTFGLLLSELYIVLLAGYPLGTVIGVLAARLFYSRMGDIFVNQNIGMLQNGVHSASASDIAGQIEVRAGEFHASSHTIFGGGLFLAVLMLVITAFLLRRMRRYTWAQMIAQNTHCVRKANRNRLMRFASSAYGKCCHKLSRKQPHSGSAADTSGIYSLRRENLIGILGRKFMFERKGTFLGIIISLSLGAVLFLGTTYAVQNTKIHNALTFKADDGLNSDIQVYEDSHTLSDMISADAADTLSKTDGIASLDPVSYTFGEIPLENGIFKWPKYYPETADEEGFEQEPYIMERYHGIITRQSDTDYRLKTNVYGYSDRMLEELEDYILEGGVDPLSLRRENTVILKTLMDGQGNYNGIDLKPGDTIRLKVPKDLYVPEEALRFEGPKEWYMEKEFKIAAIVSRSLGKTDQYLGNFDTSQLGIIMTNDQMAENFGIEGYNSLSITLTEDADHNEVANAARAATSGTPNCLVTDYTSRIEQQNLYLKQRMFFFYGIAVILLLISIFHSLNSMQYLVASRKHEFGILRAMGITDAGFRRLLLKEGFCYGICSGIFLAILYHFVQKILYYALCHVFLYLHPLPSLPAGFTLVMAVLNILICITSMQWAGKEVLDGNIIDEIRIG